jgi:hypothetical protein
MFDRKFGTFFAELGNIDPFGPKFDRHSITTLRE